MALPLFESHPPTWLPPISGEGDLGEFAYSQLTLRPLSLSQAILGSTQLSQVKMRTGCLLQMSRVAMFFLNPLRYARLLEEAVHV